MRSKSKTERKYNPFADHGFFCKTHIGKIGIILDHGPWPRKGKCAVDQTGLLADSISVAVMRLAR
jgi:hypothetical protein